ncbi:MAG: glutamyl-tRNA reductase [Alphaproteobacteria bacterium]
MAENPDTARLLVVGANHHSSSIATRDRLFIEEMHQGAFLERLRAAGLDQAVLLSTCDRIEVQAASADPDRAATAIVAALAAQSGMAEAQIAAETYRLDERTAARHIFAVAASLDSQIAGEPNVLGQVKDSHRLSRDFGLTGPELDSALEAAYSAAKKVRTQTGIGERPVSIAAAAERLTQGVHGALDRCAALLVAGGDMGEMIAEQLRVAGLKRLVVTARVAARAEILARGWSCHHAPFDSLDALLAEADIVITAVASGRHLITHEMVVRSLAARRQKPIFLIDVGVPGDVEPAVNAIDGAFLYDLDDLEGAALEGRAGRDAEAAEAAAIIDREVDSYFQGRAARRAGPAVAALRDRFEAERRKVLDEIGDGDADQATRLLINRLLHAPSVALRRLAQQGDIDDDAAVRLLNELFDTAESGNDDNDGGGTEEAG